MGIIIFIIALIITLKIISKNMKEKLKVMINNTTPENVILMDILIFKYVKSNKKSKLVFMPVLKNISTNEIYIAIKGGNYGNVFVNYSSIVGKTPTISVKNIKKENIPFGTQGRLFIEQRCGNISVVNNKFTINDIDYIYEGNIFNTTGTIKNGLMYNMTNNNIAEIMNNAILYKGIADFDTEETFKEYFK